MSRVIINNEAVAGLICSYIAGNKLNGDDLSDLNEWISASVYNQCVVNDLLLDERLRGLIITSCHSDPAAFWKILFQYRTALPSG